MKIYFPDGNGGRKIIAQNDIRLADLKLTGFSKVAGMTGEITDDDNVLTALAKIWNHKQVPLQTVATPSQSKILTYTGSAQNPTWDNFNSNQLKLGGTTSATNAGNYNATFTPLTGFAWEDASIEAKSVSWTIERATISTVPSQSNTLFFDGTPKAPAWRNYDSTQLTIGGTVQATAQGTYNATFTPKANFKWSDGSTSAKNVSWAIGSSVLDSVPTAAAKLTYTGAAQSPTWNNYDAGRMTIGGTTSATDVGTYSATFTPVNGVVWSDGSSSAKTVSWTISKASLEIPTVTNTTFSYSGNNQAPTVGTYDAKLITVTGNAAQVNAGTYSVICALKDTTNYQWTNGTTANVSTPWTIRKVTLETPTVTNTTFTFDGKTHAPTVGSYNSNLISVTNTAKTNAGDYNVVCTLKDKTNYQWLDGTTSDKSISWTISKATVAIPTVMNTSFEYDGKSHAPTIGNLDANAVSVTGNEAQTNAGDYTIKFALKDEANYQWQNVPTEGLPLEVAWSIFVSYTGEGMLKSNTMRYGTDCFIFTD